MRRGHFLIIGTLAMLFAGIIYSWSIIKVPFTEEFGWTGSSLALNFTLTMCCFCIGGFIGGILSKKIGPKIAVIASGILAGGGFILTSLLNGGNIIWLYLTYAIMAGLGIGISYNVILSTIGAWFPDKKGFATGCMMMGFGASTLLLGNLAGKLFAIPTVGWRKTYVILGVAIGTVLIVSGLFLRRPSADTVFPASKTKVGASEEFDRTDYTTGEMLKRFSFYRAFICLLCLTAVGNTVISFARDLAVSVGAAAGLATTLVGVLAVCNGLGRIITGAVFDVLGRKTTMIAANVVTIFAAGVTLLSVVISSLPLCIVGLCLTGISYGSCPTLCSTFVASFYGQKHFPTNFSIINFNLIGASFIATACSGLLSTYGGYIYPFVLLVGLSVFALILNFSIKRP